MAIFTGILLGLSTLVFVGPVFFYLLQSSIENGFKAGLAVALGIIIGDILCVLFAVYGLSDFFSTPQNIRYFGLVGGIILIILGVLYLIKREENNKSQKSISGKSYLIYGINGFLINFVNPFVFAVWFGFYAIAVSSFSTTWEIYICLSFILLTIFSTDLLKVYFAQKLTKFITLSKLTVIFKILGLVMIGFGIRLLLEYFQ